MDTNPHRTDKATRLRKAAEAIVAMEEKKAERPLSPEAVQEAVHDLNVHQIELEMQNEELRRSWTQLEASQAKYVDLYDRAPVGYVTLDAAGLLLEANLTAATLLGVERNTLLNRQFGCFIQPEDQDIFYLHRKRLFKTGTPQACEFRMVREGSSLWWAHAETTLSTTTNSAATCRVALMDISESKHAEEERRQLEASLRQQQQLQAAGALVGGVAHDFNNLLMGIINCVELCRDGIEPYHPIRKWIDEIYVSTERSAKLTQQLLAFSRKQTMAPKVIDINDAIASMLTLLRRLIGEDIAINMRPGPNVWPVKMDPSQIDQILVNLVVNARDAIGGVGSVSIETSNITLNGADEVDHDDVPAGDYVLITVTDTGCGMDAETRRHIFEPFFTRKGEGVGTGLGLATVYGILQQNSCFIDVHSEPGKGSSFNILLPRCAGAVLQREGDAPQHERPKGNGTVLLVEDERSIRVTTHIILEKLGYTVLVAEDPKKALQLVAEHPGEIDLLITDVIMPGMNGSDLAHQLSEDRPALKCLFISGYTADIIAQRGILEDDINFLSKPFRRDALAQKVHEILDGE